MRAKQKLQAQSPTASGCRYIPNATAQINSKLHRNEPQLDRPRPQILCLASAGHLRCSRGLGVVRRTVSGLCIGFIGVLRLYERLSEFYNADEDTYSCRCSGRQHFGFMVQDRVLVVWGYEGLRFPLLPHTQGLKSLDQP